MGRKLRSLPPTADATATIARSAIIGAPLHNVPPEGPTWVGEGVRVGGGAIVCGGNTDPEGVFTGSRALVKVRRPL